MVSVETLCFGITFEFQRPQALQQGRRKMAEAMWWPRGHFGEHMETYFGDFPSRYVDLGGRLGFSNDE